MQILPIPKGRLWAARSPIREPATRSGNLEEMTTMAEVAVGIDLGTSNSCVAIKVGEAAEVIANEYGERTTASVVCFGADGTTTVGNAARANILHDPARTVSSAKRLIGRYYTSGEVKKAQAISAYGIGEGDDNSVVIEVNGNRVALPEISAAVLTEMKAIAERHLGQTVTKAVITVPANFNDSQRQATKDAGRIAGLEVLRILNEPTAAALAYGCGKGLSQRIAVWDLGGGTFDISVLQISDEIFEVLSTCGDTFLGGDDFDDRLIDLLADEFFSQHGISLRNNTFALERLKVAAEGAKQSFSTESEVEIRIPDVIEGRDGEQLSIERTLEVGEYKKLVTDLLQQTFAVCDEALRNAGVVTRDLDSVILVGGPTRLPLVREAVTNYFQQEPQASVDPDEVVAMGAAIHAASLLNPDSESFLLDVTPLSLRIGVAGGLAETIIERNTPVPIEQTRRFTTFKDFQESVEIRVYQGEMRNVEENELLGQFTFSGFEKGRRGEVSIDITFSINADGIVDVTAKDVKTGEEACTRITLSAGLTENQIEGIIERSRTEQSAAQSSTPGAPDPSTEELISLPGEHVLDPSDFGGSDGDLTPATEELEFGAADGELAPLLDEAPEPEDVDNLDLLSNLEESTGDSAENETITELAPTDPLILDSDGNAAQDELFDQPGTELTNQDDGNTES
jgi:molecular chaperone DnaK